MVFSFLYLAPFVATYKSLPNSPPLCPRSTQEETPVTESFLWGSLGSLSLAVNSSFSWSKSKDKLVCGHLLCGWASPIKARIALCWMSVFLHTLFPINPHSRRGGKSAQSKLRFIAKFSFYLLHALGQATSSLNLTLFIC